MTQGDHLIRDPEDRLINELNEHDVREKMLDKTIADTFPASDPPSSIPDPDDDSFGLERGVGPLHRRGDEAFLHSWCLQ